MQYLLRESLHIQLRGLYAMNAPCSFVAVIITIAYTILVIANLYACLKLCNCLPLYLLNASYFLEDDSDRK